MTQVYIVPQTRACPMEQLIDGLQNPPINKIISSRNPLLSMAVYQGEVIGTYVRKTESKIKKQERKEVMMRGEIVKMSKTTEQLEATVTNLSAENEVLQDTVKKRESEKKHAEENLEKVKSTFADFKTMYNPKNVKRREATKVKQISQLERRLDKKSDEVKELKEQLKMKETEKASLQNQQRCLEEKIKEKVQNERVWKVRAQKRASKWRCKEKTTV